MDTDTAILFGLIALIGANHVLVRTPWARKSNTFFWSISIIDLVAGSLVLVLSLPGFESFPGVHWLVGLLLIAHVAQNLQLRATWRQEEREEAQLERVAERRAMRHERDEREARGDAD